MEFFRAAIGHYLAHLGARDAAALFTNAAPRARERGGIARDEVPSPLMRVKRPSNRHLPAREHRGPRAVEAAIQEH
jgi:hypothetical protein